MKTLMQVHAHPDDEASKGAGTTARYHAQGVRTVLVCCTGGEEGEILNPVMDLPEVRERLYDVRMDELRRSCEIIGYDEMVLLGYRDSGMKDAPANEHPDCFAAAPLEEAVGRMVAIIRRHRPQVIVSYAEDRERYPHPDHLRVHEVCRDAFDAAGDPRRHPEAGPAWQPLKMYHPVWSKARLQATHDKMLELGLESPFPKEWLEAPGQDHLIAARIEVSEHMDLKREALLAHATQVDPASPFWFPFAPDVQRTIHPYEEFVLQRTLVGEPDGIEDDLFARIDAFAAA